MSRALVQGLLQRLLQLRELTRAPLELRGGLGLMPLIYGLVLPVQLLMLQDVPLPLLRSLQLILS